MHSKMHCFFVLTYERAHTRAFENFGPSGVLGVEDAGPLAGKNSFDTAGRTGSLRCGISARPGQLRAQAV
jgi:hypothetical protein